MNALQIYILCVIMFALGMLFVWVLYNIVSAVFDFNVNRARIINYLKTNNNYNLPYLLVYKNLTREEKREILKKVGNK